MAQQRSVLLVDDSKFARLLVKAFISSNFSNWEIDEAEDGNKALEMVEGKSYDYLLLDFNMPGMNGLELGEQLRGRFPDAVIALLTANIQQEIQKKAASLGLEFLAKPPTEEKIRDFIAAQEAAR
ncbi:MULTISPECIES: response regulator transcription factor [Thalassospira]|uniref:Response regulator receiver protein n=2 Tax=Thalassospira TaxID=168934 RepID=A0A367WBW4_9PROT|nr:MULTISPECIES: response regulator [Thalassospira]MDG4717613.1 response regulator [Thalassospira sp. FZY0004]RCK38923.1 response regulator receiver protein [Thalassospira profundimaris]